MGEHGVFTNNTVDVGEGIDDVVLADRKTNYVREGPGSFHEVLVVVKEETPLTVLDRQDGWIHVRLPDERTGWIAETSVDEASSAGGVSTETMAEEWVSTEATTSGVAAAVRGFQMNADRLEDGSVDELMAYLRQSPSITSGDLQRFHRPIVSAEASGIGLHDISMSLSPYDPTVQERRVGLAVATRLSSKGLVEAPRVQRYLTLITEQLTAETPFYDWGFDIVIVEGAGPDAFACPGGIIVLTQGVFRHFDNEAQLAGLIAHEIAHVVRRHGMAERDEREVQRRAETAFAELDEATEDDDKYDTVADDLETMVRQSYERVVNDRLLEYEKEADHLAVGLLGQAGYAPSGIHGAVQHIAALRTQDPNLFGEDYLEVENVQERLDHLSSVLRGLNGGKNGARLSRRFNAYGDEFR